ncbi:FKBP-type peptidyl-prolyl cis-trans isomerase [Mucilaginibacter sp. FT3.2]|uniref:FKBP-type peptidyl-prolyl cis-trans isomerase n=1 Tax=Mucilaginibacter sp. FT3.2 TaxID=2723090 RepID=UPI00161CD259|nr:FKBP-type peptidyl-prolyl cis-trans isomerase [Mucilaginibacter sp. FT3.2]MBB6230786.1 FKBP-type peptidyl-prolyl cis-trans isomerase [Mucilaginibacter sp. FT3.2]
MKKILFLILFPLAIFSLASCSKSSDNTTVNNAIKQAAIDDASIKTYLTAHPEITNVKDTLGVYYEVIATGTGGYPTDATAITASYTGTLLDGSTFDSSTSYTNYLGNLISGWRIVLPHVRMGSRVLMLIPSLYGYGTTSSAKIPANSVLIFDVTFGPAGV